MRSVCQSQEKTKIKTFIPGIFSIAFAIRQYLARASTLIGQKHPPPRLRKKNKTKGTRNQEQTYWATVAYWTTVASTLIPHKYSPEEGNQEKPNQKENLRTTSKPLLYRRFRLKTYMRCSRLYLLYVGRTIDLPHLLSLLLPFLIFRCTGAVPLWCRLSNVGCPL